MLYNDIIYHTFLPKYGVVFFYKLPRMICVVVYVSGCHGNMSPGWERLSRFPGLTLLGRRWTRSLTFGSLGSMYDTLDVEKAANSKSVMINLNDKLPLITPPSPGIRILGADLGWLPRYAQFLTCCFGVFFFYLIYGYLQVRIYAVYLALICQFSRITSWYWWVVVSLSRQISPSYEGSNIN